MSIFSNNIENVIEENNRISVEEFVDFVSETSYQMDSIFSQYISNNILNEEETSLAKYKNYYEPEDNNDDAATEKVKKTLIDKVKEILSKFIAMVKKLFNDLADKINEMYMNTNLEDKFFSRYKSIVTFDNLKKAREKGWKGISEKIPSIAKIVSMDDTYIFTNIMESTKLDKIGSLSQEIYSQLTDEDAQRLYYKFEDQLKEFVKDNKETYQSLVFNNEFNSALLKNTNPFFCISRDQNSEAGTYYPTTQMFAMNKYLAENGQKRVKEVKNDGKKCIKNLKIEKRTSTDNIKRAKKKKENRITMLFLKSQYKLIVATIKIASSCVTSIVNVMKVQHQTAIINYIKYVRAIKKFALK